MITSLTNESIKQIAKLQQKKYRDEWKMFVVEGEHLVEEAQKFGIVKEVYTTVESIDGKLVSEDVMRKIVNLESAPKVIALCEKEATDYSSDKVLMLDAIQDPGNLGTLIRSALSFGFRTIILGENTVDPYSPKVLRSTQGAIFQVNLIFENMLDAIDRLQKEDYCIYGTSMNAIPLRQVQFKTPLAVVLGNEGNGVALEVLKKTNKNITIEMKDMESLNVAVAGSIIMYATGGMKNE